MEQLTKTDICHKTQQCLSHMDISHTDAMAKETLNLMVLLPTISMRI